MNHKTLLRSAFAACALTAAAFTTGADAQTPRPTPTMIMMEPAPAKAVAGNNNLYCAGYIQHAPMSEGNRIIGGQSEAETYNFDQNDFLYINMGADKGVNVGDVYSVVRPRGRVESRWASRYDIGFYVQELGTVEVIRVKDSYSVARVKVSCDSMLLGDLIELTPRRESPVADNSQPIDLFADWTGKARGRILMSRDGAEMLARDYVAYVDLGALDRLVVGDKLTVYRMLGTGNLTTVPQKESVSARDEGFQSDRYRGGKFSNQAGRKWGGKADVDMVTTNMAKEGRPNLRQIVGEAVVINVKEKAATIVITRNATEIHTGDWVEIQ